MNKDAEKILSLFTDEMDKQRIASNEEQCIANEQTENYICI